jgi:outer membrane receptor protein involved in Fe transport
LSRPAGTRLALFVLALFPALAAQPDGAPKIEPVKTSITVVERVTADAPVSLAVVGDGKLSATPGVNLDDRLRDVPGFSLFRRSSSLVAHPTTQGVSLRGIGPSGASRTLVLWDGVPANDPFGGWIYWSRFSPDELDRVEIARGASTSVFGDRAMGGVLSLISREPAPRRVFASWLAGNRGSHEVTAGGSHLWNRFGASARVRAFTTNGYFIVPEEVRGAVDREAGVRFLSALSRLDYFRASDRLFLKIDVLAEDRENGTVLQRNSTGAGTLSAHYSRQGALGGVSILGWHTREEFRSSFSAVAAGRNSERLTTLQSVPAESSGGALLSRFDSGALLFLAGGDLTRTEGYSRETLFPSGRRLGGGSLFQHGGFFQLQAQSRGLRLFAAARYDLTGQDRAFFSPSGGFVAGRGPLRVRGSLYRSFRAPTLNELHRAFRVGNALTEANPDLRPEKLFGAEAGADLVGESRKLSFTVYRNSLADLITNITLSSTPSLIVRQRRNAAAAIARGIEVDGQARWGRLLADLSYLFADSRFDGGARVPQVPRHQGSGRLSYSTADTLVSLSARSFSAQFEDERNLREFLLPGYASVQLSARRRLVGGLSALVSVENVLDREYLVGLSPTPLVGAPRLWRLGLHWGGL